MLRLPHLRRYSTAIYKGPAFAFDIDGVFLRGGDVIPSGQAALSRLYNRTSGKWRAPTAFITNNGSFTEASRAKHLSDLLDVPIKPEMLILSHTPIRPLAAHYNSRPGLVITIGRDCASVLHSYGFQRALDAEVFSQVREHSAPLCTFTKTVTEAERALAKLVPEALFVMADSRDWGRDIQVMVDVMGGEGEQRVDMYFCNADLTFPGRFEKERLAGGCVRVAFEAIYERVSGGTVSAREFGKPFAENYVMVEEALREQVRWMGFEGEEFEAIYGVGDNPLSDIRGANLRGRPWVSVLLRSGIFQGENCTMDPAKAVFDNALLAVEWALAHSR